MQLELECKVCGHVWFPRSQEAPKVCPRCRSRFWAIGRQRASRKKSPEFVTDILPLSHEQISNTLLDYGLLQPIGDAQILLGTTNAGPWHDMTDQEPLPIDMFDLLEYQNGRDGMLVVSDGDDGMCLTGDDIYPGDVIQFRKGIQAVNNHIVLAIGHDVFGHFFVTTKHYFEVADGADGRPVVELRPSNPDYSVISAFPFNVHIEAVAVNVIRRNLQHRLGHSKIEETRRTMAKKREQIISPKKGKKKE